jgi:hypothetical protein
MSIGFFGSIAAQPLAQPAGDAARAQQEDAAQARASESTTRSADAAGIGHTAAEEGAGDRDADGRRPWELRRAARVAEADEPVPPTPPQSRDPSGVAGTKLDLMG